MFFHHVNGCRILVFIAISIPSRIHFATEVDCPLGSLPLLVIVWISAAVMAPAPPRNRPASASSTASAPSVKTPLNTDSFLNELKAMFEGSVEKGSVWVTLKRSCLKSKAQKNKLTSSGEPIEYKCLVRATNGKKTISTSLGVRDHQRFQASYATILKAHMTTLKKRERRDKRKAAEADKKQDGSKKKVSSSSKAS